MGVGRFLYYGSFVPGMQEVVETVVRRRLSDVSVIKLLDGAIIFETGSSYDRLNFFCFNNIFAVIDIQDADSDMQNTTGIEPLESHIRKIIRKKGSLSEEALQTISGNNKKIKTFRLVCSFENVPASINETLRQNTEDFIAENSSLNTDRSGADTEFWFLYRREGFSVFMKRLTHSLEKRLHPGELSSQLGWLLCEIGELAPGETVVDPFCGYGAIPEAAVKHFHIKKFYALDADSRCIKITRQRPPLQTERCEIHTSDISSVSGFFKKDKADAIITDPPWGMYRETEIPIEEFYREMLSRFSIILKSGGRCVILTAARQELEAVAAKINCFSITKVFSVLVSGKKAAVYKMVK